MKLSSGTIAVLKNFAEIGEGLWIRPGKELSTIDKEKNILAQAVVTDEFPVEFGIYELSKFLNNISVGANAVVEFLDGVAYITNDEGFVNEYRGSPKGMIQSPPDKKLEMKSIDVQFTLTKDILEMLLKYASLNGFPNFIVTGDAKGLTLKVLDTKVDTSNLTRKRIGDWDGPDFSTVFKEENLKMIPDDYEVKVTHAGFALFTNKTDTLKYFVATQKQKKENS